jgi:hypothetical protein
VKKSFLLGLFLLPLVLLAGIFVTGRTAEASYLFIGDSRFVGMQSVVATDSSIEWIDKVGAGHRFYWQNRDAIAAHDKNTTVIYALGVNDLDASRCLKALQDLSNLGFKRIYFVATTPIDEAKAHARGYTVTNAQIMKFNADVAAALPPRVYDIDAYAYLLEKGIESNDGLHYQAPTYRQWYTYMMNYIR